MATENAGIEECPSLKNARQISQFQVALHSEFPILHHIMIKLY